MYETTAGVTFSPASESRIDIVDMSGLRAIEREWQALADDVAEPNVFYEPWMMLAALDAFHPEINLRAFLVWEHEGSAGRRLAALFPFEVVGLAHGPLVRYRLLRYHYCSLCTPLARSREAVQVLIDGLRNRRDGIYDLTLMHGDGPINRWVKDALGNRGWHHRCIEESRALCIPFEDAETWLRQTLKGNRIRDLKRLERRLSEHGELRYDDLPPDVPPAPWVDEFLALEAQGWKGDGGGALNNVRNGPAFLHRLTAEAQRRGRLVVSALRLNGQAIAMNCLLRADDGLYAFRTCYSEAFAHYSPGVLLSVHDTRRVHAQPEIRWIDSCADPASKAVNHLWKQRRSIVTRRIAPHASLAGLMLKATDIWKGLRR